MNLVNTVHGVLPNIYSKEKFVTVMNKIKAQHDFEKELEDLMYEHDGEMWFPSYMEDLLVRSLEMMFMDVDGGAISLFIYDYDFCSDNAMKIEVANKDDSDDIKEYKIENAEQLYDYLIDKLIWNFKDYVDHIETDDKSAPVQDGT